MSKCLPGDTQDKTKQHNREQSCALLTMAPAITLVCLSCHPSVVALKEEGSRNTLSLRNISILTAIIIDFKVKDSLLVRQPDCILE